MFCNQIKEYATRAFFTHGGEPKLVTENIHDTLHDPSRVTQNNSKILVLYLNKFIINLLIFIIYLFS